MKQCATCFQAVNGSNHIGVRIVRTLVAFIMLGLLLSASVWGQVPNLPKAPSKEGTEQLTADKIPAGVHELTATDVETFLDGLVPLFLDRDDRAGNAIAVVKDGKLLFAKGYGYADTKRKSPSQRRRHYSAPAPCPSCSLGRRGCS